MTIKAGDRVPNAKLFRIGKEGIEPFDASEYFAGRKVVVFGLPGAFTPTCSGQHLPGYVDAVEAFKAKGIDAIACLSVNDAWVMRAWGREQGAVGKVDMLGDGNAELTRAMGLETDMSARGYGIRSRRYAMVVDSGVVRTLAVEEAGAFEVSSAEKILAKL